MNRSRGRRSRRSVGIQQARCQQRRADARRVFGRHGQQRRARVRMG
eukprot:gene30114-39988_t